MSAILGTSVTGAGGAGGYSVGNSLRFRSSASANLSKTYSTSRTSGQILTFSTWIKRGILGGGNQTLFNGYDGSSPAATGLSFSQDGYTDQLFFQFGGASGTPLVSTQVFRDPSAWYHIVLQIDTTQATNTNRVKMYVNNVQITSFASTFYPSQNATHQLILNNSNNRIGSRYSSSDYFDGYLGETHCIDGQALTPSSFGETNASTGVWQPKAYAGSYGTNGFYLKFSSIATTSGSNTGLGQDFSGNGNFWNTNNISVTAGVTYDAMLDSPTPVSDTVGNYCVLSPLAGDVAPTNGNLYVTGVDKSTLGTVGASTGKWYFEMTCVSNVSTSNNDGVGVANCAINNAAPDKAYYIYRSGGVKLQSGGSNTSYGATFTTGDVIGVAYDADAGSLTFYKNNVSQGVAFTGITGTMLPVVYSRGISTTPTLALNFGQQPFVYTPPAGFKRYQTFNLPTPTIGASSTTLANKYFDATLWTGTNTSGTLTVSSLNFQPDFIWGKTRSVSYSHGLHDSVRGINNRLCSNNTSSEDSAFAYGYPNAVSSTGFTAISGSSSNENWNQTSATYVAWCWRANQGTNVTNTAGSLTSTVSANTTSGFSVVAFTTNSSSGNATIGHGLGATPSMIIMKSRNASFNWDIYHSGITNCQDGRLTFTNNAYSTTNKPFGSVAPTSSVFTVSQSFYGSGINTVAYCFAEKSGYSKFGSYIGNGSNDGTFVYTGFRPRFVLLKRSDGIANWILYDSARATYNVVNNILVPDISNSELTSTDYNVDLVSNGFKFRTTQSGINGSSDNIIYMAFAESPFNYSLAR